MMKDIAELLDQPETTIAIIGATDNPSKYGNVIYKDLKRKGYNIFPVNPGRNSVDDDQAYISISELPKKPTIINFVVPPTVTLEILQDCLEMNLLNVWVQPGAEDPAVMTFLQENHFNYLANACIMVQSRLKL